MQEDGAFLIALEGDVAAVHGDRGADAGGEEFLDDLNGFGVVIFKNSSPVSTGSDAAPSARMGLPLMKCSMTAPRMAGFM